MDAPHDLRCTRLCRHGPGHVRTMPNCIFAHALSELVPPDERFRLYTKVWDGGVDRWYGQPMTEEQLDTIRMYYSETPICEIPLWARGLHFYYLDGDVDDFDLPWDYGIFTDQETLCFYSRREKLPFVLAQGSRALLWERRDKLLRRAAVQAKRRRRT